MGRESACYFVAKHGVVTLTRTLGTLSFYLYIYLLESEISRLVLGRELVLEVFINHAMSHINFADYDRWNKQKDKKFILINTLLPVTLQPVTQNCFFLEIMIYICKLRIVILKKLI